jgi:hypothetical protein
MPLHADTLTLNAEALRHFEDDGRYDYDRELTGSGQGLVDWLLGQLTRFLNTLFDTALDKEAVGWGIGAVGAVLLGVLVWQLWRRGTNVFLWRSNDKGKLDYTVEEDTIYGVDFDANIRQAVERGDYRQAVRWVYLQTLALLTEAGRIDWQPHKTPAQYTREVGSAPFSELSRHFVRVRYGNFDASASLFDEMKVLQADITKGGGA